MSLAEARNAINQLGILSRGIASADTILGALENAEQVGRELNLAIEKRRAELAALDAHEIETAKAEGVRQAAVLVADAEKAAAEIIATAKTTADGHAAALDIVKAEHAEVTAKLDALRATAKSLAG
jgi:hypothetical protein